MLGSFRTWSARKLFLTVSLIAVSLASLAPRPARAEPMREFVMSCTYGVLAGTLVGAATLAFTDQPGENLNNIARGASIGLYSGILLGLYVVYGVPEGGSVEGPALSEEIGLLRQPRPLKKQDFSYRAVSRREPKLSLLPLLSEDGVAGLSLRYSLVRF